MIQKILTALRYLHQSEEGKLFPPIPYQSREEMERAADEYWQRIHPEWPRDRKKFERYCDEKWLDEHPDSPYAPAVRERLNQTSKGGLIPVGVLILILLLLLALAVKL